MPIDRYDLEVRPGTRLTFYSGSHRDSTARMAAFSQYAGPSGTNLLTGVNQDRKCGGVASPDKAKFVAVDGGIYHFSMGREGDGNTGYLSYLASVESDDTEWIPIYHGQTADDVPSQAAGTRCGYLFTANGSWSCPAFFDCQNTYDFDLPTSTPVDISLTNVTDGAVPRLAVVGDPVSVNFLNGRQSDRECASAGENDFVTMAEGSGRRRFAIGRVGATTLVHGNYTLTLTTPDAVLTPRGHAPRSELPFFGPVGCP